MQSFKNIDFAASRILIVDDEEAHIRFVECLLGTAGLSHYVSTTDPRKALHLCQGFRPDLVLLDLQMPELDGVGVMKLLAASLPPDSYLPILLMTGDVTMGARHKALMAGADDFLVKPFDRGEFVLRVRNLLRTRWLHSELQKNNQALECKVRERTRQLTEAQIETLRRLAVAAEYRDDATWHHTQRVGAMAALLATKMGASRAYVDVLRVAAPLHDVGKIGVPDRVLLKPGPLTPEEFEMAKTHAVIGAQIIGESHSPVLQMAREIALSHHEKWDGSGYPKGLRGTNIPLSGRIVAIADVFDALTHDRPYKSAWTWEEATAEMKRLRGSYFDPEILDLLVSTLECEISSLVALERAVVFSDAAPDMAEMHAR